VIMCWFYVKHCMLGHMTDNPFGDLYLHCHQGEDAKIAHGKRLPQVASLASAKNIAHPLASEVTVNLELPKR